jgi:SAM-dependent methyltransferase
MGFLPCLHAADDPSAGPVVEWEEVDCLLCGGQRWSILIEAPDPTPDGAGLWFAVVQCKDCGLCFTNPRPTLASMAQFYPAGYSPHRKSFRTDHHPREVPWHRPRKERDLLPWHGRGRLLDFGCGGGRYLLQMQRRGWRVTGIDVSAEAVQHARTQFGLHVLHGTLPHPALEPDSFDVITMWHALEHVHTPLPVLREAHRLLAPGGKLVAAVPNIDGLPFRWFGPAWYGLDLPRHLTHFAPQTLQRMAETAGFQMESVRVIRHSDWLRPCVQRAARMRRSAFWHAWLRFKPVCHLAGWYTQLFGKADGIILIASR